MSAYSTLISAEDHRASVEKIVKLLNVKQQCEEVDQVCSTTAHSVVEHPLGGIKKLYYMEKLPLHRPQQ